MSKIQRRGELLPLIFNEYVASAAFEQEAVWKIENRAVECRLVFSAVFATPVEEGAVGGFEAAHEKRRNLVLFPEVTVGDDHKHPNLK